MTINKRAGFTLVEVLAVIAVVMVLGTIVIATITDVIGSSESASIRRQEQVINSAIPLHQWVTVALVRKAGVSTIYVNGISKGSTTNSYVDTLVGTCTINRFCDVGSTNAIAGYMDEFRITKGVARYDGNYTPSASSFPNQ